MSDNEIRHTLHNGEIVTPTYAKNRIVATLRRYNIPLSERRTVAELMVNDRWYNGLLVSALCSFALDNWAKWKVEQDYPCESEQDVQP